MPLAVSPSRSFRRRIASSFLWLSDQSIASRGTPGRAAHWYRPGRGNRCSLEGADRGFRHRPPPRQGIVPNRHFAAASSDCLDLYRDGYALSALMVSQAVAEGIWRFVLERNQIQTDRDRQALAATLVERKIVSAECADAFSRIWRSFRNDVHHMNPSVSHFPFRDLAKRNLNDLTTIERETFAVSFNNGKLVPVQPLYWDLVVDGTTSVFLRNPWIGG
jgi:hypothetical protein